MLQSHSWPAVVSLDHLYAGGPANLEWHTMQTWLRTVLLGTALASIAACSAPQRPEPPANSSIARTITGEMDCRTLDKGEPCGREHWTLTVQADGSRTMRSFFDGGRDAQQINVVYRADAAFHFLEAFSNAYSKGKPIGSGFYVADGGQLQVVTRDGTGFHAEQLPLPERFSVLLHPPSLDGWHFGQYDMARGGPQPVSTFVFGAVDGGPRVAAFPITLEFVGRERITVPAGTFDTEHFRFGRNTDVWTMGTDRIMVRHEYRKSNTRFELGRISGPIVNRQPKEVLVLGGTGDLLKATDIEAAVRARHYDVIISVVRVQDDDPHFFARFMAPLAASARATSVGQIIHHSAVGAGKDIEKFAGRGWEKNPGLVTRLADQGAAEDLLRVSGVPYTIIRNADIYPDDAPSTGTAVLTEDDTVLTSMTRADLALLTMQCFGNPACINKTFHVKDPSLPWRPPQPGQDRG